MNWNDERVELLRKLWQDGLSASQIAAQLGGVSRNAVIGKVHRLKLSAGRRLKLVELSERTCKWPNGDPLAEDFNFCGNDSAETGPYCQYHARLAFQPASERRRR